jgi:hypothetical protein
MSQNSHGEIFAYDNSNQTGIVNLLLHWITSKDLNFHYGKFLFGLNKMEYTVKQRYHHEQ